MQSFWMQTCGKSKPNVIVVNIVHEILFSLQWFCDYHPTFRSVIFGLQFFKLFHCFLEFFGLQAHILQAQGDEGV